MRMQKFLTSVGVSAAVCATVFATAWVAPAWAQTDPGRFVPPGEGTLMSYERKSQGSYGTYDGPVHWTLSASEWNGRPVTSWISDRFGGQYLDPKTHAIIAAVNPKGQVAYSFHPDVGYDYPLAVGKSWTSTHSMTQYLPPRVVPVTFTFKVESYDDVTVPAGTFKAFKVVSTNSFGEMEQWWVAPSQGIGTVKRISDRPASHPLGAGHLEAVLVSRTAPPR